MCIRDRLYSSLRVCPPAPPPRTDEPETPSMFARPLDVSNVPVPHEKTHAASCRVRILGPVCQERVGT
eukprot:14957820-Alexandrium_andersonii.AAC.1